MFDVVVVGAGAAGLSSALILGRARRRTLVLDSGKPRNAPSSAAHGVFTRDGTSPADLISIGRSQLTPYASVELQDDTVTDARILQNGFEVIFAARPPVHTRKLLLAHGVTDELPDIPGVPELWGKSVVHCPYCHGWEVRDLPIAMLGRGDAAVEFAKLLLGWSRDLVICTNGPAELTQAHQEALTRQGVLVRETPISRLEASGDMLERIVFTDGSTLSRRALFVRPGQRLSSDLSVMLGCEQTELGLIRVDESGETSVPGVFAAGDVTTPLQQVIRAAASGAVAATTIYKLLATEDFVTQ